MSLVTMLWSLHPPHVSHLSYCYGKLCSSHIALVAILEHSRHTPAS